MTTTAEQTVVRATITRIRYAERGRCIALAQLARESRIDPVTGKRRQLEISVLGNLLNPQVGQEYEFSGAFEFNDKYKSWQLAFDGYRTILPTDIDGIASYLIDVAKWVGPATAKTILEKFGTETLKVIKDHPEKVAAEIPGLTAERVAEMRKCLLDNEAIEQTTVELNAMVGGILGTAAIGKAIKRWGQEAPAKIRSNPYVLRAIHGVGFRTADAVAMHIGFEKVSPIRQAEAVRHILEESAGGEGHTTMNVNRMAMEGAKLIGGLEPDAVQNAVEHSGAVVSGFDVALGELDSAESFIAAKLASMAALPPDPDWPAIDLEGLAEDQAEAARKFSSSRVFILTGAPGTGKTYLVGRIVRSLNGLVAMAAPTGKAAKQMAVALGESGPMTIHSLLEPMVDDDGEFTFTRGRSNPLPAGTFIIDEFSMVDVRLAKALLEAIPDNSRILIVGDHYQLPSVGPGAVLRDLIDAGVPSHELRQIKRNAGRIVRACHAIKDGQVPDPSAKLDLDNGENWRHLETANAEETKTIIHELVANVIPAMGVNPMWGLQLISPTNERGELSCDRLNELAKGILNPEPAVKNLGFSVGDKVVRTLNKEVKGHEIGLTSGYVMPDETVRVVNGDLGTVQEIRDDVVVVKFQFPNRLAFLSRKDHHLKLAYCLTCHKMQGSECEVAVIPLAMGYARMPMVTREWIYTAFSRAKRFLITVGEIAALGPMVARVGNRARQTTLAPRMAALLTKGTESPCK